MRKELKFLMLLLAAGLILGLAGCPVEGDGDDGGGSGNGGGTDITVSFEPFASPSIYVENMTGERLIAFKNSLSPNTLISGIPAYANNHGLKKDAALFNATSSFVLLLVTEAQYNENKDNLGVLTNQVYAKIFAFYNDSSTNNNIFQISAKLGGEGKLSIVNPLAFNVEIRNGSPTGEILGYAAPNTTSGNVISVNSGTYDIYPVYKLFSPIDNELFSTTPKYKTGDLAGKPYMMRYGFGGTQMNHTVNLADVEDQGDFDLSSGSAYLRIINNFRYGVDFKIGTQTQITSMGMTTINAADSQNFALNFGINSDGTIPETRNYTNTLIIDAGQKTLTVESYEFELDYMYEIQVLGTTVSDMVLGEIVKKNKVDLNKIFGLTN